MCRYPVCMRPLLELPAAVVVGQWPALPAVWMLCWLFVAWLHPPSSRQWLRQLPLYLLHRPQVAPIAAPSAAPLAAPFARPPLACLALSAAACCSAFFCSSVLAAGGGA